MGLNFKNTTPEKETTGFVSQFIKYGVQLLKINGIELKQSAKGDKYQIKFLVETKPISKDFQGAELENGEKAQGLVGKVNLGIYFDPTDSAKLEAISKNLMFIAEKAGVVDAVRAIPDGSFEDTIQAYAKIISGKFMWFIIQGEEYDKGKFVFKFKEGKVGQDTNGNKIFQVFCKHADFAKNVEKDDNGINVKVSGYNVVGSSIGKADNLDFSYTYDLKRFESADEEMDDDPAPSSSSSVEEDF